MKSISASREIPVLDWHGLYRGSWKGEIAPGAMAHPAKFARALIRKIYAYAIAQGYLREGDSVIDPFAGGALGALDAMSNGLHWTGVELEPKFVALGNENLARWTARYAGKFTRWGSAQLVQGDSRRLLDVLKTANFTAAISSPPYAGALRGEQSGIDWSKGQGGRDFTKEPGQQVRKHMGLGYSTSPENLGNLREGEFDAAISSPPFSPPGNQPSTRGQHVRADYVAGTTHEPTPAHDYGGSEGQLGVLPMTEFNAAISSPPYEGSISNHSEKSTVKTPEQRERYALGGGQLATRGDYSESADNLGNAAGETFWTAARTIVAQTHAALKAGGYAFWVCKDFVRAGRIVPFCDQWRQLCEACGFETIALIRAWQVEEHGTQLAADGNHKRIRKSRKSFFRRLHESKHPETAIDFEQVLVMLKP